jgi:hypothetical protein
MGPLIEVTAVVSTAPGTLVARPAADSSSAVEPYASNP